MYAATPTLGELVLLGGGHAQVDVLKQFAMHPLPGLRLTLVTQDVRTPYSGMLPGFVEGVWSEEQIHIDLSRLAAMANARLIMDPATAIDADAGLIHFASRPSLNFDMLSINIGGQPDLDIIPGARQYAIPVKPISTFQTRLEKLFDGPHPERIAIIGGGAAGCELALALSRRWRDTFGKRPAMSLFSRSKRLMPQMNSTASALLAKDLQAVGCTLFLGQEVREIKQDSLCLADGTVHGFDACFLVSAIAPPAWMSQSGLALDERGFINVLPTLQSTSHPAIFASGDIASLTSSPRPKAGVFAVRAGPVLGHNLRQFALGGRLRKWRPQSRYLAIIGTADGKAVAVRGKYAGKSRLWWAIKKLIDRRWMAKYTDLRMPPLKPPLRLVGINGDDRHGKVGKDKKTTDPAFSAMRCLGCGAKTGHETLAAALRDASDLAIKAGCDPALMPQPGLDEDSAIMPAGPSGHDMVQSVDMISEIVGDPYRLGRIAAVHALSDLYAANAVPAHALAIINLAEARADLQQAQLTQILTGALEALAAAGVRLVGGHTSEGPQMGVGFSVTGFRASAPAPIDGEYLLVLSKPLGSGIVMAGHMELVATGKAVADAINFMEQSNAMAAQIFNAASGGAAWMTDVTGFGLARHAQNLIERAGFGGVEINISNLPLIDGVKQMLAAGIKSSLFDQNRAAVRCDDSHLSAPHRQNAAVIFDPQTSGGMLALISPQKAHDVVKSLKKSGHQAAIVGRASSNLTGLSLVDGGMR